GKTPPHWVGVRYQVRCGSRASGGARSRFWNLVATGGVHLRCRQETAADVSDPPTVRRTGTGDRGRSGGLADLVENGFASGHHNAAPARSTQLPSPPCGGAVPLPNQQFQPLPRRPWEASLLAPQFAAHLLGPGEDPHQVPAEDLVDLLLGVLAVEQLLRDVRV